MNMGIALAIGLLAGAHTSTWGMYKDCPYEGFTYRKYLRSILISALLAVAWQLVGGLDLSLASGRLVLFGLTYATERGLVELYKGFLREEDQAKYFIPMQFHVMGRVVHSRAARWSVAAVWIAAIVVIAWTLRVWQQAVSPPSPWLVVLAIGSIGGWIVGLRRSLQGCADRGLRDLQVLPQPRRSRRRGRRSSRTSAATTLYIALLRSRLHGSDDRDLQDVLLPQQAARQVRRQADPASAPAHLASSFRAALRRNLDRPGRKHRPVPVRTHSRPALSALLAGVSMNCPQTYATLAAAAWLLIGPPGVTGDTRCVAVAPGECLQVTVTGHGQDVVLIPGLFGSAFSFRHVVRRLTAAGYRSIVIEPLGVGDSARPRSGDYSLDRAGRSPPPGPRRARGRGADRGRALDRKLDGAPPGRPASRSRACPRFAGGRSGGGSRDARIPAGHEAGPAPPAAGRRARPKPDSRNARLALGRTRAG